ncbi:MAG: serine/threonine protein kinase [Pirellulaceae bacterium]|nr:serine/threonine protein kinase [Pirellulaceae bacterium]
MADPDRQRRGRRRFGGSSAEELERLRQLCDCFEQQLLANQRPRIELFLGGCRPAMRLALLEELLGLEVEYDLQAGRVPDREAYARRFPEALPVLHDVFAALCPAASTPSGALPFRQAAVVIPNYSLLSELGSGGMGTVYRAVHALLKNEAAIKVLKAEQQDDPQLRELFDRETRNLGQLRHPQIVQALYAGFTGTGSPYLVMELVRGVDVAAVLRRCGPLPVADACEIIRQAAIGLQHAHECGLIHRDIKPSNLLLGWTYSGQAEVKVADFGLARLRFRSPWQDAGQIDDRIMGTLDYMSPEQYFTPADVDIRADIFSLGCTLFSLLVGHPPFQARFQTIGEKMRAHRQQPLPAYSHLRPDVPPALIEVIASATAKDRSERFETPLEFAASLAHFHAGHDLALLLETAEERPDPGWPADTRPADTRLPADPGPADPGPADPGPDPGPDTLPGAG